MAGLRRKKGGKAGFENPYCGSSVVVHQRVVDVCYSRALATENVISNENRAIKKSMTQGDILTQNKVLRKRSP